MEISCVYDQDVISDGQIRNWFSKISSNDTSLRDQPRLGRSSDLNQKALRGLMEFNPRKSTRELTFDLNTSKSTICHHFKKIGKVCKLAIWVSRTLKEKNLEDRISTAARNDSCLKNIITSDEK